MKLGVLSVYCTISINSAVTRRASGWFGRNWSQVTGHSPFGRHQNVVRKLGQKRVQIIKNRRQSTLFESYYIFTSLIFIGIIIVSPEAPSAV